MEGFDNVHSPIQIDRPFPIRDEASIRQVYDRLLYPIWGDDIQLKAFLWMLARATAGHCEDKIWSVVSRTIRHSHVHLYVGDKLNRTDIW